MCTQDSIPQLEGSSHSCIEVSLDEEFVFGVNLLLEVMYVVVEGLLYCSVSLLSWCVHNEGSGKLVVLDWES